MKRLSALITAVMLLALAIGSPVAAARPTDSAPAEDVYLVVLNEEPVVAYEGDVRGIPATKPGKGEKVNPNAGNVKKYVAYLNQRHTDILARAGAGADAKFYDYHFVLNGFAAVLTPAQAGKLAGMPEVMLVERDVLHEPLTDNSPDFLGLTDPTGGLWADHGLTGEDVIVGVIDTGIWPEHPSFSDQADLADRPGNSGKRNRVYGPPPSDWHGTCQSGELWSQDDCNNKLIGARYFLDGFGKHGIIQDDYKSARDKDGHGTHTASTAAGNADVPASIFGQDFGPVSGMAPRARVAMYKALWNDQGGFSSDLAAAIDAAVADGVDVINYSIGSSTPSLSGFDEIAFLFAANAGVFVATSAGNTGPGSQTIGSPASVPWVTTVGASTQDRAFEATVMLGDGAGSFTGASVTGGTGSQLPLVDSADVAAPGADPEDAELCIPGSLDPALVTGNVVLCLRGLIARVDKSLAVDMAGGAGMILYNPDDAQALVTDNHWVPSVHINFTSGSAIKAYIAAEPSPTAEIFAGAKVSGGGNVMADFSSRGPNGIAPDIIKPDVTAPGVNILAGNTPNPFLGRPGELFQSISGTSMSSPHVAGVAALIREAHPDWDLEYIKSALMTTGRQNVVKEDAATAGDPFDFGGGHIVPNSAIDPGLVVDAGFFDYLAFLCTEAPQVFADPTGTCSFLESQGFSLDPSDLNLPSIGIAELAGNQTVTRTFTSVLGAETTWETSIEGLSGINVTMPATITVGAGAAETVEFTFSRDTAALDEWTFGAVLLSHAHHTVRLAVAVKPVAIAAPSPVTLDGAGDSGSLTWDVQVGYTGTLAANAYGVVADSVTGAQVVPQDPDQDIATDTFSSGVIVTDYSFSGVQYFAGGTRQATTEAGSDLDVFLFYELEDGDPGFSLDDLVTFSADGDSEEIVQLVHPADGNYRLVVHGWGTPDGASTYDLHEWVVSQGSADSGTLSAAPTAGEPLAVSTGDVVEITGTFSGLTTASTEYRGVVDYSDGTDVVGTSVVMIRH